MTEEWVTLAQGEIVARPMSLEKAQRALLSATIPLGSEEVGLEEAWGRILAEDISMSVATNDATRGRRRYNGPRLRDGIVINSKLIYQLGLIGRDKVRVYRPPRVALITTGNEIVEVSNMPLPFGKSYNVSLFTLTASVKQVGGNIVSTEHIPDDCQSLKSSMLRALDKADVVLTTGGVSVGRRDLMPKVLTMLGAQILFYRLAFKPGAPTIAALLEGKPIICLSGNPSAALMAFEHVCRPLICVLGGNRDWRRPTVTAQLAGPYRKPSPIRRFLRAKADLRSGKWWATVAAEQRAGMLSSLKDFNSLVDVPAGSGPLRFGERVKLIMLDCPM